LSIRVTKITFQILGGIAALWDAFLIM